MLVGVLNSISSILLVMAPTLAILMIILGLAFLRPQIYLLCVVIIPSIYAMPIFSTVQEQLSALRWVFLGTAALVGIATSFKDSFSVLLIRVKTIQVFMLSMVAVILCTSAYSINPVLSFMKGLTFLMLPLFFMFGRRHFVGDAFKQGHVMLTQIGWFLRAIVALSLAYGFIAPSQVFLGLSFGGIYGNPNALAGILGVFAVPLFLYEYICERRFRMKVFHGAFLLITIGSLFATRSRAGILSAFVASLLILFYLRRQAAVALLGITLGITVSIFSYDPSLLRVINQEFVFKGGERVLGTRELLWQEGVENIMESPFWGWGYGTSRESVTGWGTSTGGTEWSFSTSTGGGDREKASSYLGITEELGFIGAMPAYLLMLYLLGQFAFVFRVRRVTSREEWPLLLLLYSIILGGLISVGFEAWFFSLGSHIAILYWLFVFLYSACRYRLRTTLKSGLAVTAKR